MAARPPPARLIRHVRPPSSVARMVPIAPTAQPCSSSAKLSASSGSRVGVGETVQVWPPSGVCSTRLPGVPASQHFGPRTASAAKSNKAAVSRGKAAGGRATAPPMSAVNSSSPPSPASQANPGATKSQLADRLQSDVAGAGGVEIAAVEHGELSAAAGQHARPLVAKIAGQPAVAAAAAQGRPAPSAVASEEGAGGKHRRGVARRPAALGVEEADLPQGGEQQPRVAMPMPPAVARGQHHAGAGVQIGMREAAGGPAGFAVEEADASQRAADAGFLLSPVAAAVVGLPDGAAVADGPAAPRIDEADVVQPGVIAQGLGGRGVECLGGLIAGRCRRAGVFILRRRGLGRLPLDAKDFATLFRQRIRLGRRGQDRHRQS